jgi:release factor glutamine methyltransferase
VPSPEHDAQELAAYVLGTSRAALIAAAVWSTGGRGIFEALVRRRAEREPLQHLTERAYFRHLELAVGPGVFIPRPETELLVDLVLADCGPGKYAVDLCAGSGAVGLAVATEAPGTAVHLVEADSIAAGWLLRNMQELAPGVVVHQVSVSEVGETIAAGSMDVVTANPPYVPLGAPVGPEVGHDPALAVWGGVDGLDVVREVAVAAALLLRPGGLLAVEHDESHQPQVIELLQTTGFTEVTGHQDLTGRARFVTARAATREGTQ